MQRYRDWKIRVCGKDSIPLHIFSFSWFKIRLFKILQKFLHIWNGMVKGFSKMYNFSFFGQICFANIFIILLDFGIKNSILQICNFFAVSKSRAQELSNDVSFVIFGHQTLDLEGGSNWPPQHILVFKYPSRGWVNLKVCFYDWFFPRIA